MRRETATRKATADKGNAKGTVKGTSDTVQLRLLPGGTTEPDWMLDERTRTVGRQGVAHSA